MKSKLFYFFLFFCSNLSLFGQENMTEFSFNEFLGYVKKYHPLVKQADLKLNEAQANLMQARGAFDPKIEVEYNEKQFKNSDYFSILNSSFKIPTWYGIELKAGFDNAEGIFVNPENTLPNSGLTSLGVAVPIGQPGNSTDLVKENFLAFLQSKIDNSLDEYVLAYMPISINQNINGVLMIKEY